MHKNAIHSEIPDAWYFRGTPNNWGTTGMTLNPQGLWETLQTFGDNNPRFKISHYADNGSEAYPASDYLITGGAGTYEITFNSASKQVVAVVKQPTGPTVTIHYREFQPASSYSIHAWDGVSGDIVMDYEGYFQNAHWWKGTLDNIPANFKFCFRNSNGNWDGVNRLYSGQSHEIYSIAFSSDVYLTRP